MHYKHLIVSSILLALNSVVMATPATDTTFGEVTTHYEAARRGLLADALDEIPSRGEAIAVLAAAQAADFDAEAAGVPAERAEDGRALLLELAAAARQLAAAADLTAARDAFYELSKPLGRYRKLTGATDSTQVMYCPMVKKAWLQPPGAVGNPYMGASMPDCGRHIPDTPSQER